MNSKNTDSELQKDYAKAVGTESSTHASPKSSAKRIAEIYGTARKGKLSEENANLLEDFLRPIMHILMEPPSWIPLDHIELDEKRIREICEDIINKDGSLLDITFGPRVGKLSRAIPTKRNLISFDEWMICIIVQLAISLKGMLNLSFAPVGIAQKLINLFIKDRWSQNQIAPVLLPWLHIPLDRASLSHIDPKQISHWKAWTKANLDIPTLVEYWQIQLTVRAFHRRLGVFQSPMALDQLWWMTLQIK
jgi:hypothetical protein